MIYGKKVYCIIPVRKGSKGVVNKNRYEIEGKTLLERTILQAKRSQYIDEVFVSTDCEEMNKVAVEYKVDLDELRPSSLAKDESSTIDVINYILDLKKIDDGFILLLQVTSPFRLQRYFDEVFNLLAVNGEESSVVSINESQSTHPDKIQVIREGKLESYLGKESMVARQLLTRVYELNGAFYLTSVPQIKNERSFFSQNTIPYKMPAIQSLNLDTELDLILLEALLERDLVEIDRF